VLLSMLGDQNGQRVRDLQATSGEGAGSARAGAADAAASPAPSDSEDPGQPYARTLFRCRSAPARTSTWRSPSRTCSASEAASSRSPPM
jgi:hypothetical protein